MFAQFGECSRDIASHLTHGHMVRCLTSRSNKVGNGFCLTKVHLAVEESPLGVFSWKCHPTPVFDE